MLYVKAEDGKVLEVIRSQFKDMQEVLSHSQRIFGMASDHCLVTPPIHGIVGVLVSNYKTIGKHPPIPCEPTPTNRFTATEDRHLHQTPTTCYLNHPRITADL